jgi:cytochrome P450
VLRAAKEGLFLSRDGMWSMLRKTWQPAFHSDSLAGYAPGMASEARRLVDRLAEVAAAGEPTDIWRDVGRMTMSVVGSAAYGVDFHLLDHEGPQADEQSNAQSAGPAAQPGAAGEQPIGRAQGAALVHAAAEMFKGSEIGGATRYLVAAHLMPVLLPLIRLLAAAFPDERYRRLVQARETLRGESQALIDATRRAARAPGRPPSPPPSPSSSSPGGARHPLGVAPGSFLGLLLSARGEEGHGLSDLQMAAQANVFTLAGYEVRRAGACMGLRTPGRACFC